jgi:hypothetical protein
MRILMFLLLATLTVGSVTSQQITHDFWASYLERCSFALFLVNSLLFLVCAFIRQLKQVVY